MQVPPVLTVGLMHRFAIGLGHSMLGAGGATALGMEAITTIPSSASIN